jgi:hypothetical protein
MKLKPTKVLIVELRELRAVHPYPVFYNLHLYDLGKRICSSESIYRDCQVLMHRNNQQNSWLWYVHGVEKVLEILKTATHVVTNSKLCKNSLLHLQKEDPNLVLLSIQEVLICEDSALPKQLFGILDRFDMALRIKTGLEISNYLTKYGNESEIAERIENKMPFLLPIDAEDDIDK